MKGCDAVGKAGISVKCTFAIRQLAYAAVPDFLDEYLQIGEKTSRYCLMHFCSIDCIKWPWAQCPQAYRAQFSKGDSGSEPFILLEVVASQDLWIWHVFFGVAGSNNDVNVLCQSPVLNDLKVGKAPEVPFVANDVTYKWGYYLTDGIYPEWVVLMKSISQPWSNDVKRIRYKQVHEATRKDVERAPVSDEDLREYCDKNYHQILPIIAEKLHQEKAQQEKLKAVKARLKFEEASSESPEPRCDHFKPPREKGPKRRTVFKRLEQGVFHRLGDKEKNVSAHSRGSERKSYYSSRRDIESCYQSSRSKETETAFEKHHHKREYSRRTEAVSESEGSTGSQNQISKSRVWRMTYPNHRYDDLRKAFLENYLQLKKCIKAPVEIHNIKQRNGESTEEFVRRYKLECRDVKGAPECMKISGFMHGITNPELIKEILALDKGKFKPPPPMTTPVEKRNASKFCEFHGEVGHTTDESKPRKRSGKYNKKGENLEERQTAGNINGATMEKDIKEKDYSNFFPKISNFFPTIGGEDGTEGPMIIEAEMGGHCVHHIYVDGGSSSEILYEHYFSKFRPEIKNQLIPAKTSLVGFSGEIIWPLGQISLLVKIGDEEHSTTAWMNFMVVRSPSPYNEIIGRPRVRKIRAIPSTTHGMIKFPVAGRIVTLQSNRIGPLECSMVSKPGVPRSAINQELCGLLRRHLDVFAWKPVDITGVSWHIAEHRLNVYDGCLPIRQKKRGQAPERNKAISEEVKKLVDADIMKEVHYHSWLSNPVMCTKKSDFQWTPDAEGEIKEMKQSIAELPMLTAPKEKEELIMYLAAAKEAISTVLMTERDGKQVPVYFVSCILQGPEINYTTMEKLILALVTGRLLKWRSELREHDIQYRPRTSVKGQILADFIVERSKDEAPDTPMKDMEELPDPWILFTDGS
uniref:Reverse transcriptase domain-containing protein n=1 Tax=Tanacetum cinerariifolium TaxID=118510 RepID=A0A6L2K3U5_TANCI|nr:hypothetical protein [Tanacetum cinerariifolium]